MTLSAADEFLTFRGGDAPGKGKRVVLVAADQEYRSEESIPALARILAKENGFNCTVLFSINRKTGEINPSTTDNVPGLEALRKADLLVLFARWLMLPDEQMKEIIDYTNSGRPIVTFRTSTHPFRYTKHFDSPYAKYSYDSKDPVGGYGRLVVGETWVAHYGEHQKESTRGVIAPGMANHPILRGVTEIWGASDVYAITTLSGDSKRWCSGRCYLVWNLLRHPIQPKDWFLSLGSELTRVKADDRPACLPRPWAMPSISKTKVSGEWR
jgi:hypothetical protein